jgi:hypothetical protein
VLFLGYALFIWPVRDQYGSGVRWRVAALGATAYLLALRLAYLFCMPNDPRLAKIPASPVGLTLGNHAVAALRHLGTNLLGAESAGQNLPALLLWCVGAWAVFKGTQRAFDKTTAFRALLLFSVLPVFFWTGSSFGPEGVLLAAWAVALWLMTFAIEWPVGLKIAVVAALTGLIWFHWGWLPGWPIDNPWPSMARPAVFAGWQALLVTPAALIGLRRHFARLPEGARRAAALAAAACAVVAMIEVYSEWTGGRLSIVASGAIWLPLLPLIATEMQRPGRPPSQFWSLTISLCAALYGLYFYYLAFCA